jgi:hypothetical protein
MSDSKLYRKHKEASSDAPWEFEIFEGDDFDVGRITLNFDSAPSEIENVTVTIVDESDSTYDALVRIVDPNNKTSVYFECINNIACGDKVLVSYANTGGHTISGKATVSL